MLRTSLFASIEAHPVEKLAQLENPEWFWDNPEDSETIHRSKIITDLQNSAFLPIFYCFYCIEQSNSFSWNNNSLASICLIDAASQIIKEAL